MSFSTTSVPMVYPQDVSVTEDTLATELSDGRSPSGPLAWYPRLVRDTVEERSSGESQRSFEQWLSQRASSGSR
jgi:hypothetical protein